MSWGVNSTDDGSSAKPKAGAKALLKSAFGDGRELIRLVLKEKGITQAPSLAALNPGDNGGALGLGQRRQNIDSTRYFR